MLCRRVKLLIEEGKERGIVEYITYTKINRFNDVRKKILKGKCK